MFQSIAPFPNTDQPFDHEHDIGFVPLIAFLGAQIPGDALGNFRAFRGERLVEHVLADAPHRVATAWLGKDRMIGGEITSLTPPQSVQLHPATIHWHIDGEHIGWIRLFYLEPVDARASQNRLEIVTTSEIAFLVNAHGARIDQIEKHLWQLPNLSVRIETNANEFLVEPRGNLFEIRYSVTESQKIECILFTDK
jgi:hypothetical protein